MRPLPDITGRQFGRLTVIERKPKEPSETHTLWRCICSCGTEKLIAGHHLRQGRTRSCGCLNREVTTAKNKASAKHGMWRSSEFNIWQGMIRRCESPKDDRYKFYGARGVTVCQEWRESFKAFYEHIGPRPSPKHSVDRIRNDLGYQPGNVRWATSKQQATNKTTNVYVEICGERMTVSQAAERYGVSRGCIRKRLERGLRGEDLLAPPHPGRAP